MLDDSSCQLLQMLLHYKMAGCDFVIIREEMTHSSGYMIGQFMGVSEDFIKNRARETQLRLDLCSASA